MRDGEPSRTAVAVAAYRAAHQTMEGGAIFADPLAHAILGTDVDEVVARFGAADPAHRRMRLFVAARSRFAEDSLALAVSRGVRQAVILGAGLDTFSLRNPSSGQGLEVFEVDHPATQAWKRRRLAEAGLGIPAWLTFAPLDLERQDVAAALVDAGFEPTRPAFFTWLGVVTYLPRSAIAAILRFIAGVPDAEVVLDYSEPLENVPEERRAYLADFAARAAAVGEPWVTCFDPAELSTELHRHGFLEQEDLGLADIAVRYLGAPPDRAERTPGAHVVRARRIGADRCRLRGRFSAREPNDAA